MNNSDLRPSPQAPLLSGQREISREPEESQHTSRPPWHRPSSISRRQSFDEKHTHVQLENNVSDNAHKDEGYQWVRGVHFATGAAIGVLVVNITLTVVASGISYSTFTGQGFAYAAIYRGSCKLAKNWSTGLHVLINILSTIVLAASNYCMQCLSSPSREEVDRAHAQRYWLHIGTASLRNLRFIPRKRLFLWLILLLTSWPLHLIYNSTIFVSVAFHEPGFVLAPTNSDISTLSVEDEGNCFERTIGQNSSTFAESFRTGDSEYIDKHECWNRIQDSRRLAEYAAGARTFGSFAEYPGTVVLLSSELEHQNVTNLQNPVISWQHYIGKMRDLFGSSSVESWAVHTQPWQVSTWSFVIPVDDKEDLVVDIANAYELLSMPGPDLYYRSLLYHYLDGVESPEKLPTASEIRDFLRNSSNLENQTWAASIDLKPSFACLGNALQPMQDSYSSPSYAIDGCQHQKLPQKCEMNFIPSFCLIVIICNFLKIAFMLIVMRQGRKEILLTVGDAVASFLDTPDLTTKGRCLMSKTNINRPPWSWQKGEAHESSPSGLRIPHSSLTLVPGYLPRRGRWMSAGRVYHKVLTIILMLVFLMILLCSTFISPKDVPFFSDGAGEITLLDDDLNKSPLSMSLIANAPQLGLSMVYFISNDILTNMLLAAEYSDYAHERKPLRVSWPSESQRSSYYLSIPYKYSIPMMSLSAVMHWLMSQAMSYVNAIGHDQYGTAVARVSSVSFSGLPSLVCGVIVFFTICAIFAMGFRKLKGRMPIAGNSSAAISAACHPPEGDRDASLKGIMWGEVDERSAGTGSAGQVDELYSLTGDSDEVTGNNYATVRTDAAHPYTHCCFTSYNVVAPSPFKKYA